MVSAAATTAITSSGSLREAMTSMADSAAAAPDMSSFIRRLLRERVGRELVWWSVLPFARPVRGFSVFLGGHDLALAPVPKAGQPHLIDLAPLRRRAGLPRAPLERAHHAALDHRLEAVHTE